MRDPQDTPHGTSNPQCGTSLTLLARLRANEPDAWRTLVHLYSPLVYHWCGRGGVHGADADDVSQEVFRAVAGPEIDCGPPAPPNRGSVKRPPNKSCSASATAGGPYTIAEGSASALTLNGTATPPSFGRIVAAIWDLNGDGIFGDAATRDTDGDGLFGGDASDNPALMWADLAALGLDDDGVYPIAMRAVSATDSAIAFATLTITNTAPILSLGGTTTTSAGVPYTLNLSASDAGDDAVFRWTVDWKDGSDSDSDGTAGEIVRGRAPAVTHVYQNPGSFQIAVRAQDEDAITPAPPSPPVTKPITVNVDASSVSAGGPYTTPEGSSLTLAASAVGSPTAFAWDIGGDFSDASGPNPTLIWAQLQGLGLRDNGMFQVRVRATYSGDQAASSNPVTLTTVFDDNAYDVLTGSAGQDWFFAQLDGDENTVRDLITDLNASEFANDIDWINS